MLTIRRFQKGDEEILSVMIRRTLREVNYTSPKSELDYLIPHRRRLLRRDPDPAGRAAGREEPRLRPHHLPRQRRALP